MKKAQATLLAAAAWAGSGLDFELILGSTASAFKCRLRMELLNLLRMNHAGSAVQGQINPTIFSVLGAGNPTLGRRWRATTDT